MSKKSLRGFTLYNARTNRKVKGDLPSMAAAKREAREWLEAAPNGALYHITGQMRVTRKNRSGGKTFRNPVIHEAFCMKVRGRAVCTITRKVD